MRKYYIEAIEVPGKGISITRHNEGFTGNELHQIHLHSLTELTHMEAGIPLEVTEVKRMVSRPSTLTTPSTPILSFNKPSKAKKALSQMNVAELIYECEKRKIDFHPKATKKIMRDLIIEFDNAPFSPHDNDEEQ